MEKQPAVDTVRLTRELEAALRDVTATLPHGIRADQILFRQADFIETSIRNVAKVLLEAAIVVAFVLFAFLLNLRTMAISLTAIPVSILGTAIAFHWAGLSINTMTLGGQAIAIGELVDDAVVDVENIFRRLRENRAAGNPRSVFAVVVAASNEVRSGIVYATMIIVLVFVPLFALSGIEGRLFAPLVEAYIVSILMSLLVSITLTPVMACYMLPRAFLPPFNEGSFTVNLLFNPGISLVESHRVGLIAERLILEVPEVKAVGRRTGRAELDEHAEGVHSSEIEVDLKPAGRPKNAIVADIRARLAVLPVVTNVGQPISHRLDHMLSGVRAQIALKISGEDLGALCATAERMRERLATIPGIVDLQVEKQVLVPQLELRIDYARAALYGVQPAAVTEQLERLSNGRVVSRLVDGNRRFDVVVRLPDRLRTTQGLGDMLIETPRGWVPVRQIADVVETDGRNQILRENQKRRVVVLANADGEADMAQIIARIRAELAATPLPVGMFTTLEGTFQAQEEASRRILVLSLVSFAMILAILYSRYRSLTLAPIIMGSIPMAFIGSVVALWIAGQPLSAASMIGFITLTGIAARNGILKVSHTITLAIAESLAFGPPLVVRGSLERMTPVLMTALSAGLALIPLIIDPSAPGKEILHPVAVTIFGGLVTATLLDAFLTPLLLLQYGRAPIDRLVRNARESQDGAPEIGPRSAY